MSSEDEANTNAEQVSKEEKEEEPTLPAKTSQDNPTAPAEKRVIIARPTKTEYGLKASGQQEEQESLTAKAKDAGQSLKELVTSAGKKAKTVTEEKTKQLKDQAAEVQEISTKKDAQDIQALGANVEKVITTFEDTMTEIRNEPYSEQERLLIGYKKLLEEQINVITARLNMAKRLKANV
jgi:hypothetical protein